MHFLKKIAFITFLTPFVLVNAEVEEVVVTANKKEETVQEIPMNISVITDVDIQERGITNPEDFLRTLAGVTTPGGARFYSIRGLNTSSAQRSSGTTSSYVDEIPGTTMNIWDIDRIEVLRGPQGTLHGANAMAGLINVRSNEPQSNPFNQISLGIGYYDHHSFQFVSTGPLISDSLLYRFALGSNESNGSIKNRHLEKSDTNDIMEITSKFKLEWTVNPKTKLSGHVFFIDTDNGFDAFSLDNSRNTLSDEPGKDTLKTLAGAIKVTQDFSPFTLNFQASFSNSDSIYSYDEDWTFVGIAPGWEYKSFDSYARERDAYSLQARLTSKQPLKLGSAMSDWSIGLFSTPSQPAASRASFSV